MKLPNFPTNIVPKSVYPTIKEYISITFGLLLVSCGWKWFIIPHEIAGGGATGLSAIIQFGFGIPLFVSYLVINMVLLVFAIKNLGWAFSIKTIFAVLVLTLAFALNPQVVDIKDPFMSVILGGLFNGAGLGIVFLNNGSTGGTDIIAKLVTKKRNITLGRVILYTDICIISSSLLLPNGTIEKVIFGLVCMAVTTLTIDMVVNGVRQSVQFFIFSSEYEKIADAITHQLGRGVTVLDGIGWYSKEHVKVLTTLARKNESVKIFKIIKDIDPNAFVSQTSAIGVYGKGFDIIKTK